MLVLPECRVFIFEALELRIAPFDPEDRVSPTTVAAGKPWIGIVGIEIHAAADTTSRTFEMEMRIEAVVAAIPQDNLSDHERHLDPLDVK